MGFYFRDVYEFLFTRRYVTARILAEESLVGQEVVFAVEVVFAMLKHEADDMIKIVFFNSKFLALLPKPHKILVADSLQKFRSQNHPLTRKR